MRIIYNGVDLMPIATHDFLWEPIYDDSGVDYLFTRVFIAVQAVVSNYGVEVTTGGNGDNVLNGPAVSYQFETARESPGGKNPNPRSAPNYPVTPTSSSIGGLDPGVATPPYNTVPQGFGISEATRSRLRGIKISPNRAPLTHQAIRHRLSSPRGRLYVYSGRGMESGSPSAGSEDGPNSATATLCVQAPDDGCNVDCKNGPTPHLLGVNADYGDMTTMVIDWACEAFVNEAPLNSVAPVGPMLSNRFAQRHLIDENGYTTVLTSGVAIYRTDLLYKLLQSPDQDRPFLFMPLIPGFKREAITVEGLENATGVKYRYADRQMPVNFFAGEQARAASITALHRQAIVTGNVLEGALASYERFLNLKVQKKFSEHPEAMVPTQKPKPQGT